MKKCYLLIFLFFFPSYCLAVDYVVSNENAKVYSDEVVVGSTSHSDSGTIYAYGYMSGNNIVIYCKTSSGSPWQQSTAFGIYKNSISSSNKVASSSDLQGSSGSSVSFTPEEANYYVVLATQTSGGENVGFYIHDPIIVTAAYPDLTISSMSINSTSFSVGDVLTINATVRNSGEGSSNSTYLRYYLSSNSTISSSDTEFGSDSVSSLDSGETSNESISKSVENAGTAYIGVCVDSVTDESNTGNNCSAGTKITITEPVDNPPFVTINTGGSSDSDNPKATDFDINVTVTDDIELKGVGYEVVTSLFSSTGKTGSFLLSGTSDSATFTIDIDSLSVGSYKVKILANDSAGQLSAAKWYWFQKVKPVDPVDVPAVTNLTIDESSVGTEDFIFTGQLDDALPPNHAVFINFDDLQGNWFNDTDAGGHIELPNQGGTSDTPTYSKDTTLTKPGIRFFRAAVFDTQGDTDASNDVRVSDWSDTATCTLPLCLSQVSRPNNFGNPAVVGNGSELFHNVDVANGNYHLSKVDMTVPALGPDFSFSRAYNSLHRTFWTFAYEMKATFQGNYNRELGIGPREDGHFQYFFKDMDNEWHALNPGDFDKLIEESDGSFTLYTQGNRLYSFADPAGSSAGRLQNIKDRLNHALVFGYDGNNNLIRVTDANGRTYTVTRDSSNRISRVTDLSGRYVGYTYDSNSMITRVRKMKGSDYYDSYTYHSEDPTFLETITDSRIAPTTRFTIAYNSIMGQLDKVDTITDAGNNETGFRYGTSSTYGKYVGVTRPAVDGLNHNRVYVFADYGAQILKIYDAQNASDALNSDDIVTSKIYKTAADNSRFADLGLVTAITDPEDNDTTVTYDSVAFGKPSTVVDAASRTTSAAYTSVGGQTNLTPVATISQPGVATPIQYGSYTDSGQAGTLTDPEGYTTNRDFDSVTGLLNQSTNPRNYSTDYTYDIYGNITRITDAKNNRTDRTYDSLGRLITEESPLGLTTSYTYDAHNNILTRTQSDGGSINYTTAYEYDENDNLIAVIDPKNHRTDYEYDDMNRKIRESYTVGGIQHSKTYTYDAIGRLATVTDERNQTSESHYTERNQIRYRVNPRGTTTTYTYDKNGNVTTVTDGENRTVTTSYDALNRKISVVDDEGNTQRWTYNTAGQVSSYTDARNKVTTYTYDKVGNLKTVTDPNGVVTRSNYDGNGNLISVTDPNGNTTTYTYDEVDHRIRTTLENGEYWTYTYDAAGNVLVETTPTNETTTKQYDALNRMTQRVEKNSSGVITRQLSYTYDANNNVITQSNGSNSISYSYDELNRIVSVTDPNGQTINYGYDKAGNRTSLTYPGNKTISYVYDEANRLDYLTDWLGRKTDYTRNEAGQTTGVVYGNGTKANYDFDDAGRLIFMENLKADNSVISRHDLTLDDGGNIKSASTTLPLQPAMPSAVASFTYGDNNELLTAGATSYSYDDSGRIIAELDGVTTTYQFNINDLLTSVSQGGTTLSSYDYDLNNNRISQTQNGTETRYVIDQLAGLPNVIAETNSSNVVQNYYIYGEGLISQIDKDGNTHYYHYNPTGHTLALTDIGGNITDTYAYAPYGKTTIGVNNQTHNPFLYVGRHGVMDDGNGLHYMRARFYKEDIKRFMSLDALHGDVQTPQSLNRYAYVQGNPVIGIDPSGLKCEYGSSCYAFLSKAELYVKHWIKNSKEFGEHMLYSAIDDANKILKITGSIFSVLSAVGNKLIIEGALGLAELPTIFLGYGDPGLDEWWEENVTNELLLFGIKLELDALDSDIDAEYVLDYVDTINDWGTTLASLASITQVKPTQWRNLKSLDGKYSLKQMLSYTKKTHSTLKAFNWYAKITVSYGDQILNLSDAVKATIDIMQNIYEE